MERYRWAEVRAEYVELVQALGTSAAAPLVVSAPPDTPATDTPATRRAPLGAHRPGHTRTPVRASTAH